METPPMTRPLRLLALLVLVLAVGGCKSILRQHEPTPREKAAQSGFWNPQVLYLAAWPYPKLHVEVDAIESVAPTREQLDELRAFLERVCDKPGGITVAVDDVIPKATARGRSSHSLALEFFGGAADALTAPLYILFHDSRVTSDAMADPYFTALPFPGAIFVDARVKTFAAPELAAAAARVLQHEAGHALGLTRNTAHSDAIHCTNAPCLMNANYRIQFDVLKLAYKSRLPDFCADCLVDLHEGRNAAPPENLRFAGPALVREEANYQVATLPGMIYVHFGPARRLTPQWIAAERAKALRMKPQPDARQTLRATSNFRTAEADKLIAALERDPQKSVRELAELLRAKMAQDSRKTGT